MEIVGISEENVLQISKKKNEDDWIRDYRLESFKIFNK